MDVYVLPIGTNRYELYCEMADEPVEGTDGRGGGPLSALLGRLQQFSGETDAERPGQHRPAEGWVRRLGRQLLRHAAEIVAEQRLLWHLRRQSKVTLVHPDELTGDEARGIMRWTLARDRERHRLWLLIDAILAAVTGPLFFFVPGPNLVAYYFIFRTVGHYFAWRGARRGLDDVRWHVEANATLTELRASLDLPADERRRRVGEVADRLRLPHLAAFFERVAVPAR